MLQQLIDQTCRVLSVLMVVCLSLMVVMVFGNVVLRYGFNTGITMSEELSRWLFVWMTFLGALVALRNHMHLGSDSLVVRLPVPGKKICLGITHVLMLYVCWLLFRGAWQQTVINMGSTSAVMEVSMGWLYASGLFFSIVAAVFIANDFWKLLSGQLQESELVGIVESEDVPPVQDTGTKAA
ncbi:MAG: tripartite ATP-independent periplasmic transporter, DctQ component family protein [Ramlibacter sp.]|jgi:TRAP-type C4-dicarboxylate transport system permease small subunit|uniref:TRAP transporter small permease n=1 Tax=Ramlibacter sp. TaxID=1917967 RepID=UPI00261C238D|nr:TRAP transporter small permease [Ramlibacter sp.]MDB5751570.1 tripartite ATP-independent periplasmic transporter, DctQ component family protein [Ramlibacter sp.]